MKRFFTSDHHFFHKNILFRYGRKGLFSSIEEMHAHIITQWNKNVGKRDVVYVVGDFSFGTKEETKGILDRLNGTKILIVGNHDKRSKRHITVREYLEIGFESVMDEDVIKLSNNMPVLLKHYPYEVHPLKMFWMRITGKLGPFKNHYAFYPVDKGLWHIHGHIHQGPKLVGKQINVNVESWNYIPVSEAEICRMINETEKNKPFNRARAYIHFQKKRAVGLIKKLQYKAGKNV